jgi:hypothetical protein
VIQVRARGFFRVVLVIAAVLVSIGCFLNVYGDDSAVRSEAEAIACPRGCTRGAASVRVERSALAETVEYVLPGGTVTVRCTRAAVLVGPYSCVKD